MRDFFIDSIYLHSGFLKKMLPPNPPLFAINVYGIMQLFKFAECNTNKRLHIKLDDYTFKEKLKNSILNESTKSSAALSLQNYRKKDLSLTKLYGNLHLGNMYYVIVFIDKNTKTVQTIDPLGQDNF